MKRKKYIALLCAVCTGLSCLSACSTSAPAAEPEIPEELPSVTENFFECRLDDYMRLGGSDGFVAGRELETVHYMSAQKSSDRSKYESSICSLPVRLRTSECILSPETEQSSYYLLAAVLGADKCPEEWAAENSGMKLIIAETQFLMPVMEKGTFFATAMTGGIADAATGKAVELQNAARYDDLTLSDSSSEHQLRLYPSAWLRTDCGILYAVTALESSAPVNVNGEIRQYWTFTTQVLSPADYEDIAFYYGGSDVALESLRESFDGRIADITELPQYEYDMHFFGPQPPLSASAEPSRIFWDASPAVLTEHVGEKDINYICQSEGKDGYLITEGAKLGMDAALMAAYNIGGNYKWGGISPETGFDCSGLVYYVYGQLGYPIGRTANDQSKEGEHVEPEDVRPGDILCFHYGNGYCDHAGIYLGNGGFVHAQSSDTGILISMLDEYCSRGRKVEIRRLLP